MKKLVIVTLLLGSTTLAHADYSFVSADGSPLSELCVAAVTASVDLQEFAPEKQLDSADLDSLRCNGITASRFVLKYGAGKTVELVTTEKVSGYLLKKADSSPLTELCAAAVVSEEAYGKVKESYFKDDASIEAEVMCNGVPLKSFVRKFRNADPSLISAR